MSKHSKKHPQGPKQLSKNILQRAKTRAFLVTNLVNIRYLTGLSLSAGTMIITPKAVTLYADDRYLDHAKAHVRRGIRVLPAAAFQGDLKKVKRCAIEGAHLTLQQFSILKKTYRKTTFVHTDDVIEHFRRSKTTDELSSIRKACAITMKLLQRVPSLLKKGVSELDIAWLLRGMARDAGADDMAFETIVAFGSHTASPHHQPTDRKFSPGDIVQIDIGVKYRGYCSDYSRVFFTGTMNDEQRKVYRILKRVQAMAKRAVRAGITADKLDALVRFELQKNGYDKEFCHALGHGVGLEIHEGIILSPRSKGIKLLPNEVVTIEPGLYFPGKWGMRIEDTVIVRM